MTRNAMMMPPILLFMTSSILFLFQFHAPVSVTVSSFQQYPLLKKTYNIHKTNSSSRSSTKKKKNPFTIRLSSSISSSKESNPIGSCSAPLSTTTTIAAVASDNEDKLSKSRRQFLSSTTTRAAATAATASVFFGQEVLFSPSPCNAASQEQASFTASYSSSSSLSSSSSSSSGQPFFSVYKVVPDASAKLSPSLQPVDPTLFLESELLQTQEVTAAAAAAAVKGGVLWLGEHHNSKQDHDLQALIIENIYNQRSDKYRPSSTKNNNNNNTSGRNMAIGLEQVQVQYQPVLDAYIQGIISEKDMLSQCQWSKRWTWPFENYRSIFTLARRLKIPLIALNVDSEDLAKVEEKGFQGLDKTAIQKYIKDPRGFSDFARPVSYRTYSAYVIEPSYELHKTMGILKSTISGQVLEEDMSFRNFFSGRILWDEAMAGNAHEWTKSHEGGIMIGLVGADHVKFEKGVVGRYERLCGGENGLNVAVLLNPTLVDTLPSGRFVAGVDRKNKDYYYSADYPDQITLQLRYLKDEISSSSKDRDLPSSTGGVLSLADYIVISQKLGDNGT